MKTQILHLEPHDDLISVRDKMNWGQTGRILLVWPERGRLLNRRLDLVILQRHSAALGAQIALVTQDPDVKTYARELAIPVYKNLRRAQNAHWRLPRSLRRSRSAFSSPLRRPQDFRIRERGELPPPPPPILEEPLRSPLLRILVFALGVIAVLAVVAVLLPAAEIRLQPETRRQSVEILVQANPALSAVNFSGMVPARRQTVVVEGREYLPTSGEMSIPDEFATGQVRFTNLTTQEVVIPAGTVVRTTGPEPVRFATTAAGSVPAGEGKTALLPVRAVDPGGRGNLDADRLVAVEGELGTRLTATNPRSTTLGSDRLLPAPSPADREQLEAELHDALHDSALKELQANLQPGDLLLPASLGVSQVLDSTFDPADDEPADQLGLNLRLEYEVLVVPGEALQALAIAALDANLPGGFTPRPESLEVRHLTEPKPAGEVYQWRLQAGRQILAEVPAARAVSQVLGADLATAQNQLAATLPVSASPQILLRPSWWPRMPVLPFRIRVSSGP